MLSEVRANQVTRIMAEPVALGDLPIVRRAPGDGEDFDQSRWSQVVVERHLDGSDRVYARGVYRVLYVNEARWGAFTTTEGERMLPEGGYWAPASADPMLGRFRFCEEGAMMTAARI